MAHSTKKKNDNEFNENEKLKWREQKKKLL